MRILLTGNTGMIGSRLVKKLENKHTIVGFSRQKGLDITRATDCEKAMKNVDVVIHAAADLDETKKEDELQKINVEGTRNLLEAAEKNDVQQFIFLSSVGVYGETTKKLDEKSELHPQTAYERSKKDAEELVWKMQEVFPVTIIRPALVVGPSGYWKQIFSTIQKGFPLIGKGENAWQMVDADDLVAFIVRCVGNENVYNEAYIVAEKETHTLREVVDMVADILHTKKVGSVPKMVGMAAGYVFLAQGKIFGKKPLLIPAHVKRLFKHREYDISKALETGWKPTYTTQQALEKTYAELVASGKIVKK